LNKLKTNKCSATEEKMSLKIWTVKEFLKEYRIGRVQIGTRNMSYIDNANLFIVYDINAPHQFLAKTNDFDAAWRALTEDIGYSDLQESKQ
jgi:hypothetical protein